MWECTNLCPGYASLSGGFGSCLSAYACLACLVACLPVCLCYMSVCLPICLSAFLFACPFLCAASNREVVNAQAETAGVVWCMERSTFRSIIVVSSMQKRQRYEECLASMPLFASLTPDQRAAIADCLSLETFQVCPLPVSPAGTWLYICSIACLSVY